MYYILLIIIIISILYYKFNQSDILNEVESFKDLYNLKKKGASLKIRRTMRYSLLTGEENTPLDTLGKLLVMLGGTELEIKNSSSLHSNLESVLDGEADFAIVPENYLYKRITEDDDIPNKINFISAFYEDLFFLLAKADNTNINTLRDFKDGISHRGRNYIIGTGEKNSHHYRVLEQLCRFLNIDLVEITLDGTPPPESDNTIFFYCGPINTIYNLFLRNMVDGVFVLSGARLSYTMNLSNMVQIKIIPFPKRDFSLFKQISGTAVLEKQIIVKENIITTENIDSVETFGIRNMLVCRKTIKKEDIYEFTKNMYSNLDTIKMYLKSQNNMDSSRNVANLDNFFYNLTSLGNTYEKSLVPLRMSYCEKIIDIHPGAKQYYIEKRLINIEGQNDCDVKKDEICRFLPSESKKNIYWKYERLGGLQTQFVR